MDREILFRGKKFDNGEWVDGFYFERFDKSYIMETDAQNDCKTKFVFNIIPETLGQFTGLYDATKFCDLTEQEQQEWLEHHTVDEWKGKRIFEWDILEASNGNRGCVIFENGAFMKLCDPKDMPFLIAADVNRIIGNIHDNPEMLNRE